MTNKEAIRYLKSIRFNKSYYDNNFEDDVLNPEREALTLAIKVLNERDAEYINSLINKATSQIRRNSEHFINDEGEDSFAIYEDDAIQIITSILRQLVD